MTSFGTAALAYLASRDKLKFDGDKKLMELRIEECELEREKLAERASQLEERATKNEVIASGLQGEQKSNLSEIASLRLEVRELRDRLYGTPK